MYETQNIVYISCEVKYSQYLEHSNTQVVWVDYTYGILKNLSMYYKRFIDYRTKLL